MWCKPNIPQFVLKPLYVKYFIFRMYTSCNERDFIPNLTLNVVLISIIFFSFSPHYLWIIKALRILVLLRRRGFSVHILGSTFALNFIYGLVADAVNSWEHISLNGRLISKYELVDCYFVCFEGLKETKKYVSHDSLSLGWGVAVCQHSVLLL